MSPMRIIILLVAATAAVVAALMVRGLASQPSVSTEVATETIVEVPVSKTQVLVASRDMSLGDILAPEDMVWAPWPDDAINVGYYTEDIAPDAIEELTGSVVRLNIYDNEPMLPQRIVSKGDSGFMAALLAPGMRAIAVEISTETASGGFIIPNDRVDVILTYEVEVNDSFGSEQILSTTIIQNTRVLAIDQIYRQDETDGTAIGSTATLELGPRDAELLALGEELGTLSLSLRSVADALEAGDVVTSQADMFESGSQGSGGANVTIYRNGKPSLGGS